MSAPWFDALRQALQDGAGAGDARYVYPEAWVAVETLERERRNAPAQVPLYQPGNTKLVSITLTADEWWSLAERATQSDDSLAQLIEKIVREAAASSHDRPEPSS